MYTRARAEAWQRAGLGTQSWEANESPSATGEDPITKDNQAQSSLWVIRKAGEGRSEVATPPGRCRVLTCDRTVRGEGEDGQFPANKAMGRSNWKKALRALEGSPSMELGRGQTWVGPRGAQG